MTHKPKFRSAELLGAFNRCLATYGMNTYVKLTGQPKPGDGEIPHVPYPEQYAAGLIWHFSLRAPDPADYLHDSDGQPEYDRTPTIAADLMAVIAQASLAEMAIRFLDPRNRKRLDDFRLKARAALLHASTAPSNPATIFGSRMQAVISEIRQVREQLAAEWVRVQTIVENCELRLTPHVRD